MNYDDNLLSSPPKDWIGTSRNHSTSKFDAIWLVSTSNWVYTTDPVECIWGFVNVKNEQKVHAPINAKKPGDEVSCIQPRHTPQCTYQCKEHYRCPSWISVNLEILSYVKLPMKPLTPEEVQTAADQFFPLFDIVNRSMPENASVEDTLKVMERHVLLHINSDCKMTFNHLI